MRPLRLSMQAFGSYGRKTAHIDFTRPNQNLFLITGDTGAGKSTIFDAIVFAIYGEASSEKNKKDGKELQSQFADYNVEPFVEFTFLQRDGEEGKEYTVRRIPRHVRKKKRGSGEIEESEKVSLIMPDGMEYPQKETNRKLEEIVGLTKEQFMQVAMIAQNEFMELLRADSNDKKVIFRKLFNTDFFQKIVNELESRRKEKLKDMERIRTMCQAEVGHVVIPAGDERREALYELKNRILNADSLSVSDMEAFMEELKKLCDRLRIDKNHIQKEVKEKGRIRDEKRDAYTRAGNLEKAFLQLNEAKQELSRCKEEEASIGEMGKLIAEIRAAYEVEAVYQRLSGANDSAGKMEQELKQLENALPTLEAEYDKAANAEQEAGERKEALGENFTRVSERVEKALKVLRQLEVAKENAKLKKKALDEAEKGLEEKQGALARLEESELEWQEQFEKLQMADQLLERWKRKEETSKRLEEETQAVKKLEQDWMQQEKKAEKLQRDYEKISQDYQAKNAEYTEKQAAFFDAQAGFIARQYLKPGKPCPVCGSTTHPVPCKMAEEHEDLTREMIENLEKETKTLQQKCEKKAGEAGAAVESSTEKKKTLCDRMEKLRRDMARDMQEIPEILTPDQAQQMLNAWKQEVEAEGVTLKEQAETYQKLREALKNVGEEKKQLKEVVRQAEQKKIKAESEFVASNKELELSEAERDYPTEKDAKKALADAKAERDEADKVYQLKNREAQKKKEERDKAKALLERYKRELPAQRDECNKCRKAYEEVMAKKDLPEALWKNIVQKHEKSDAESFQEQVNAYNTKKALAEGKQESAKQVIGQQTPPDMEELERARDEAEAQLAKAQDMLEQYKADYKANKEVYEKLAPQMEERNQTMQEYTRIDSLYSRLAGKVTGSRMDIETFVQRHYLQRILYSANLRFREMSAGQFELRMVEENQAGEGKNRGLDLMVYSAVTGKEREVRTLSGGESFMAALSLALGMADQIQEGLAAVYLDMMFIDEGFGSLDEHARSQAVKVLKQMAGGSKLIGIISHVTELKQEIDDQLIVSKDENGSHVRWEI